MVIDVVWLSGPIIADPIPQPQPTVPQITDTEHEIDAVATSFPGCGAAVVARMTPDLIRGTCGAAVQD